jgi:hypothetical protein
MEWVADLDDEKDGTGRALDARCIEGRMDVQSFASRDPNVSHATDDARVARHSLSRAWGILTVWRRLPS